nr:unnamed protein product [Callosobruchus chinensis]
MLHNIITFFSQEKLVSKGENAVESGHVTSSVSDADLHLIRVRVIANSKNHGSSFEVRYTGCN